MRVPCHSLLQPLRRHYDRRALHLACCEGHLGTTEFLLNCKGIDASVVDRLGGTPLEDAHREKHVAVVALLTNVGALRTGDPFHRFREAGS